jgi:hypothetical protein
VRELIRHILKENRIQQSLKQVIENGSIFDAADLVGGITTLKKIFKDDPEMSSLFEKLTGTITFYYPVISYEDIKFPLDYEIIGRHSNIAKTNHWPEINVIYDENKLTPEENEDFKSMIKYLYDDAQHSAFRSKFEDSRMFNTNYFTVKELNGEDIDLIERGILSLTEAEELHDKLYGGNQSLNESEEKQVKYLNILKDLVEPFKDEDCVCSVKVWYNDEDDMYLIDVEVGTQEMKEKFFAEVGKTHYVKKLRLKIKETIKDYLPIDNFYVGTYATPKCGTKRWWDDSLNEGSNKEKSLIKLIKKDGLYDFIEMTGLDFNQVRSLIKQIDNPKEILKQYIREFVLEHDGMSNGDYGSLFALRLPLSNTKYVNDILVQDRDQIVVEIWGYEEDEYGHTEQTYQYLTSINVLTNEELLSIISWMMETIEGGYWD